MASLWVLVPSCPTTAGIMVVQQLWSERKGLAIRFTLLSSPESWSFFPVHSGLALLHSGTSDQNTFASSLHAVHFLTFKVAAEL